jgi:NADPH:quinone reductase-like Zn-dependent oxidoreductase
VRICGTLKIVGADPTWFRASLTTILGWARDKAIRPLVSGIRPWNKVMEAHLELAQGHLQGKLLLDFSV